MQSYRQVSQAIGHVFLKTRDGSRHTQSATIELLVVLQSYSTALLRMFVKTLQKLDAGEEIVATVFKIIVMRQPDPFKSKVLESEYLQNANFRDNVGLVVVHSLYILTQTD